MSGKTWFCRQNSKMAPQILASGVYALYNPLPLAVVGPMNMMGLSLLWLVYIVTYEITLCYERLPFHRVERDFSVGLVKASFPVVERTT